MFIENIKTALSSMKNHKMKTFLTLLGIIIGISSATTISTLGNSINHILTKYFNTLLGTDMLIVDVVNTKSNFFTAFSYDPIPEECLLSENMLNKFTEQYKNYIEREISISYDEAVLTGRIENIPTNYNLYLYGVSSSYCNSFEMVSGKIITQADCTQEKYSILIPSTLAEKMGGNVLGKSFFINSEKGKKIEYVITGIHETEGYLLENLYVVYVPYTTMLKEFEMKNDEPTMYAMWHMTGDRKNSKIIKKAAEDYFSKYYKNNSEYKIEITTLSEYLETFSKVINIITYVISLLAGFSLIIGGVGIMNVALVSVSERVKEIGIRKSLGAKNKNIISQFLTETIMISFFGGLFGVLNGLFVSLIIALFVPTIVSKFVQITFVDLMQINYLVVTISLVVSLLIGVFFGVYPARKAAKMNPVDALRK